MEPADPFRAFAWGLASAVSLPLGAALGVRFTPAHRWTSMLMAFGAGALLAALTLELVAKSLHEAGFAVLAFGLLAGAVLFAALNEAVNGRGGFLRKASTTTSYLSGEKRKRAESLLGDLSRVDFLRKLPPDEVENVMPFARHARFKPGEILFEQGAPGDRVYLIEDGEVEVFRAEPGEEPHRVAAFGPGGTVGELALLTREPRSATARARTELRAWTIAREDFERLMDESPKLRRAVTALLARRLGEQTRRSSAAEREAKAWAAAARSSASPGDYAPNSEDILVAQAAAGGAPMAIWLGILLDGIPESLVIGASLLRAPSVSPALIAGVFLANFPEALSSAAGMRRQGMTSRKVMAMWGGLALLTGVGAAVGNVGFGSLQPVVLSSMEAVAAGAMLAMIAETMLPEAVEQGGPAPGLMTVLGFLSAVYASTFGGH